MNGKLQVVAIALFNPQMKKYLIVRRNKDQSGAGHWEFPGGKVESGESQKQALVREIQEELGLNLSENELTYLLSHSHQYPEKLIEIHLFRSSGEFSNIQLVDHDLMAWVDPDELLQYNLSPADRFFISYLPRQ